ncbi:MAG: trigger factor [Gammaproteobacteria bacterium]|jgi:trigger factor
MQVSIETLDGLERKMTVQIPSDTVSQAVEKKLKDLSKTVKIDGFRTGKVPLKVVQQKFGGHVRQEVIGDVLESSYQQALMQENVRPAGMPNIESVSAEDKEDMTYVAVFEVYPEIENINLDTIKVEKLVVEITDEDFDKMMTKLREQRKDWAEVTRVATKGDKVTVDFEGRIDGELFEGGAGKDMEVEIGAGQMLKEFEEGLDGISIGEEKVAVVNFPEDYHGKDVAGKTAEFTLKATKISEPVLPEVDAEFAKAFGVKDGNIDQLHTDIRANMAKELEQRLKSETKNAVMVGLLEANEIIAPAALVAEEVKALKEQAVQRMGQDTGGFDISNLPDELFAEEGAKRVKLGLLVSEVIKSAEIELDKDIIATTLEGMAASYEDPSQVIEYYRQNKQAKANLEAMVLEDQVVEHILAKAIVTDKASSFNELMNDDK